MSDPIKIKFEKFNINKIGKPMPDNEKNKPDKILMFIGKRNTGKSWCVRDVMYHYRQVPFAMLMSGTETVNPFYTKGILPELFSYKGFHKDKVENLLDRQSTLSKKYGSASKNPWAWTTMFVLDDLMGSDRNWVKDKNIQEIFMNGRHYNIFFLATTQYPVAVPPDLRTNIDFVFIFRENNVGIRKKIYEHYAGIFPTFHMFCEVMDELTKDFGCMIIDNTVTSSKLTDVVFWYKSKPRENFRVGCDRYWKAHEKYYMKQNYKGAKNKKRSDISKKNALRGGSRKSNAPSFEIYRADSYGHTHKKKHKKKKRLNTPRIII